MERFVALFEACGGKAPGADADVYVVAVGDAALRRAVVVAEELRGELDGRRVEVNLGGGSAAGCGCSVLVVCRSC